jgi:hypothetical protein
MMDCALLTGAFEMGDPFVFLGGNSVQQPCCKVLCQP